MAHAPPGTVLRHLRNLVVAHTVQDLTDRQLLQRFVARHEEAAFAALVQRHARLVWGVCRHVLRHEQDAEDAFQATFLVLARQAGSIRKADALASWLYGVAWRTAQMARRSAAIRRARERRGCTMPHAQHQPEVDGRELQAILDEEVQRLPEKYRAPFVLCCLEGRSRAEAARELGCKEGTLWSRLAQARRRLRQRLARRGVTLSAVLCLSAVAAEATEAAAPAALLDATVRAALSGAATGGAGSASVAALVRGVVRALSAGKGRVALALVLAAGALLAGIATLQHPALAQLPGQEAAKAEPPPAAQDQEPPRDERLELLVTGRVTDADGQPVVGGPVALLAVPFGATDGRPQETYLLALTQADEHGRFRIARPALVQDFCALEVLAGATGHGIYHQGLADPYALRHEVHVKLPRKPAQRALRGRVVDLQGQPVAGASVALGTGYPPEFVRRLGDWPKPVRTDDRGRFLLPGVPPDTAETVGFGHERYAYHEEKVPAGAEEVSCTLSPARVVEGRVRYGDTGKPVANALVGSVGAPVQAGELGRTFVARPSGEYTAMECLPVRATGVRTDAQGRFRLVNYTEFVVYPPAGEPYLAAHETVDWPPAVVKRAIDVRLERGVLVRGTVREAGSGRPVAGAPLGYLQSAVKNPFYRPTDPDTGPFAVEGSALRHRSGADGAFQFAVPPGKGYLLARGPTADYLHVEVSLWGLGQLLMNPAYRRYPDAVVALDTKPGAGPQDVKVELRRGITVRGRLLTPDGKPVRRARLVCRWYLPVEYHLFYQHGLEIRDGRFELPGCDPETPRPAYVYDEETGSGATVPLGGREMAGGPVTIRLRPCGSARMRILDGHGQPVAGYRPYLELVPPRLDPAKKEPTPSNEHLALLQNRLEGFLPWGKHYDRGGLATEATDAQGRITLPHLIPGATYRISSVHGWTIVVKSFTVEAGKTVDLGDLTDRPPG